MSWFLLCVVTLIVGYFTYGTFITKIFAPKPQKATPAMSMNDGVDFVPLSDKKVYIIQLLNIAGLGPIFGPILVHFTAPLPCYGLCLAVFLPVPCTTTSLACSVFEPMARLCHLWWVITSVTSLNIL